MSQYQEIDDKIIAAIRERSNPLYYGPVRSVARRLEEATGREAFRIIDGRLQTLRKRGLIAHIRPGKGRPHNQSGGWYIPSEEA